MSGKVWLREDEVKGGHEHQWGRYYRLKRGDVFVEAGAYLCRYGRIASKKVGPEGRVILIEPSPPNIWWIKKVVKDMKLTNVTLLEKAVWNERTQVEFRIDGVPTGNRIIKAGYPKTAEIVMVEADTVDNMLDDLNLDHVDLFAADVENAEVEMVQGMERWLGEKRVKSIAIASYHSYPDGNYEAIKSALAGHGYRGIKVWGGVVYAHV